MPVPPPPEITHLSFSPDSARVLAFCSKSAVAFVFTLGGVGDIGGADDEAVEAFLEGGVEGLVRVEWSKTGNKLIGWSELGVSPTSSADGSHPHWQACMPYLRARSGRERASCPTSGTSGLEGGLDIVRSTARSCMRRPRRGRSWTAARDAHFVRLSRTVRVY